MDTITTNVDEEAEVEPLGSTDPPQLPEDPDRAKITHRVERNNAEAIAQIKRRVLGTL